MRTIQLPEKPRVIGVMGSHRGDTRTLEEAYRVGEGIAKRGHILLTGGGGGTMRAASEGARKAGGLVVAVLPSERHYPAKGYPNDFVDIPIYTGLSDARNAINAKTPDVLVALRGGLGTLSEIALALKSGTPVIGLRCPRFEVAGDIDVIRVATVEGVFEELKRMLGD
ncbi:MAG: hypothetical protein H6Q50_791 [Deltaproteobacteria bacterium]|nr:hypothetical protein [Deltaproteobacteria bacterium]